MAEEWRRIVAALADPVRREVYASIVLGTPLPVAGKRLEKTLGTLEGAGLISATGDGYAADPDVFTTLLEASPVSSPTGVHRFIRGGRIAQYPVRAADRLAVLAWARDQALPDSMELTERELGDRLSGMTDDIAKLRRYLVDSGLVVRDAAGKRYRRSNEA